MPLYCSAIVYISVSLGVDGLTPEEHDLLSRMDERLEFIQDKMKCVLEFKDSAAIDIANLKSHCENTKDIPDRVNNLEKWRTGLAYAMGVIVLLMAWGWLVVGGAK